VGKSLGIMPGRVTVVLDGNRVIQGMYSSSFRPMQHVETAMETLRSLADR